MSKEFAQRHIGLTQADIDHMCSTLGVADLDTLTTQIVPAHIALTQKLDLPPAMTEAEVAAHVAALAAQNNTNITSLIGLGYYNTHTPAVLRRNILENPAWYTAYTPYQPEISQGRLEALLVFQTMVTDLTGLDIACASLLDEATAAAEAMMLCHRHHADKTRSVFVVSNGVHPHTIDLLQARAQPLGWHVVVADALPHDLSAVFGALVQYPHTLGTTNTYADWAQALHAQGALLACATDLLALTWLEPPSTWGADIALGSSQRFGLPLGYGGPHAAFFACKDAHKRMLPGRLAGVSVDAQGNQAYRLTLQTREQHIRRDKAMSNICTAQVLPAVMAAMYAVYHGAQGLQCIAARVHTLTQQAVLGLQQAGVALHGTQVFDTLTLNTGTHTNALQQHALQAGFNLRRIDDSTLAFSFDETTTPAQAAQLLAVFGASLPTLAPLVAPRTTPFLTHSVFAQYHSETAMMRYLRRLADRDLALDRTMIPLGSCTMKLNAAIEMESISLPALAVLHPFVPFDQAAGSLQLIAQLEDMLCAVTGFDAVSLQPNSGAMGEFAGLQAIAAWHQARGDAQRVVCLIPTSAHGTNPASAVMAGMQVVAVACDAQGNIDVADLTAKAQLHAANLAALMVTYPSTHGVFESAIAQICTIVHQHGGLVYMDGANMNAQTGLTSPAAIGADVCHLNLHKTFCIPHGGGGPGVGPVAVKAFLAPFLPGHRALANAPARHQRHGAPVAAAPFGSALILSIPYIYIRLMGADGLTKAAQTAILSANYIAQRLKPYYPVLYTDDAGRVAHECILDLRPIKASTGVSVDDVAKRLIDYGFHAPTMSWPVAGTLMIEPTESEPLPEIERFCNAMIAIKGEIDAIAQQQVELKNSPLSHAPHTLAVVLSGKLPYSAQQAAYPMGVSLDKYFPPVARVDNVQGDRQVFCACPPMLG